MPELAEVEYYRKRWDCGLDYKIESVRVHDGKRIFRDLTAPQMRRLLTGAVLLSSEARGKRMLFRFSRNLWLGLHLGMTGQLRAEKPDFDPGKHDHLVLFQKERALVFSDPRLFGRVLVHQGAAEPEWWANLPPDLVSGAFTPEVMKAFLGRHRKLPLKAALLRQDGFPGIGNWMADEILWRAGIDPRTPCGGLRRKQLNQIWKMIRFVSKGAMKHISRDFSDPPRGWLFHERWHKRGKCPDDRTPLMRAKVGGRTTVWCPRCQVENHPGRRTRDGNC